MAMNRLFVPLLERAPYLSSMMVADSNGAEYLLLRDALDKLNTQSLRAGAVIERITSLYETHRHSTARIEAANDLRRPSSDRFTEDQTLPTLDQLTDELIDESVRRHDGNLSLAAKALGISRQTLYRRLRQRERSN